MADQSEMDGAPVTQILATAVYVTGNGRLHPGYRYSLVRDGTRFQVLGPTDTDPQNVALDRPMRDIDANVMEGRLIISESLDPSGLMLAFMSIAGPPTDDLAKTIRAAARKSPSA